MNSASTNGAVGRRLDVGIYGCRQAGKTRFLYQLLSDWHRGHRLLSCSANCHAFLAMVEEQMAAHGHSAPTVAKSEGLDVEVRRNASSPWRLSLRDLQGEVLADEVDALAEAVKDGVIPEQVRRCNAFLFFFDPTSSDDPLQINEHYRRELRRAELFIDYVLRARQNQHLPLAFVLTRLDLWEDDPKIRQRAELWVNQVNDILKSRYQDVLLAHHPEGLTDQQKITFQVSSVRGHDGEKVIERLEELVEQTETFRKRGRRGLPWLVGAGAVLAAAFLGTLLYTLLFTPPPADTGGGGGDASPAAAATWPPERVRKELDALDRVLAGQPPGDQLPRVEQAKQLNAALKWLPVKLGAAATLPPDLQQRLQDSWQKATALVRAKAEGSAAAEPEEKLAVLEAYLDDVYAGSAPAADLAAAQNAYWALLRRQTVSQLTGLLRQEQRAGTDPATALQDVVRDLGTAEQKIKGSKVSAPEARKALLDEVQTAQKFCEKYRTDGWYPAKFRVLSCLLTKKDTKFLPNPRRLTFESPRQTPLHLDAKLEEGSDGEKRLKTTDKPADVRVSLGGPGRVIASISFEKDNWTPLQTFEIPAEAEEPSLRALGMPLVRRSAGPVVVPLSREGYELKVEFSDVPSAPELLAAVMAELPGGKKP